MTRKNTKLLAVFCNGPAGYLQSPLLQLHDDLLIAQGRSLGFAADHFPDRPLDHLVAHGGAVGVLETGSEKIAHLEETLGSLHVFPRDSATNRCDMQPHGIGNLRHDQRLEGRGPPFKELFLPGDDLITDRKKGLLSLL